MLCEKCQERDATVHLTLIEPSNDISRHHYCEACYRKTQEESGDTWSDLAPSGETPPQPPPAETPPLKKPKPSGGKSTPPKIPLSLGTTCRQCGTTVLDRELDKNLKVCPYCQYHFPIGARERIHSLVETFCFDELDADMRSMDVLRFTGTQSYGPKLADYQKTTGRNDAVITGRAKVGPHRIGLAVMDFGFMGGTMGSVAGEKLTRLVEKSTEHALPLVIISTSGGARLHEGMFSLMQMAKTCGAIEQHSRANLPFISVLNLAEPKAMIGFAGPRVIRETTHQDLPPGFQTAEFLLDHGLLDAIVPRNELKQRLIEYLAFMTAAPRHAAVR
jgi:acetyl-CoA carboxylase carboxyl transferase subunit beta